MPSCFSLTPKGSKEPEKLQVVDDRIRETFGLPADAKAWAFGWYNTVGLLLACGKSWAEIQSTFEESDDIQKVICFLQTNYDADAWCERK